MVETERKVPSRDEIDSWLEKHCGKGIPYGEASDDASMLHGLAYVLRRIESTDRYMVNIGQKSSAESALRMALDHFAVAALGDGPASELIAAREANEALMKERESLIATKREQIDALTKERDKANRVATDRRYMLDAYWCMLGPNGLKVAQMWKDKGVLRQHTSWGPEASRLTGEERAAVLLDAEIAPKTPMESIDGSAPPSIKDTSK
jgi:hypothetical protein